MKIAFLILAHDRPEQLKKLVCAISKLGTCFIHIDRNSDIVRFQEQIPAETIVRYAECRFRVHWAGFAMVEATVALMKQAEQDDSYDYFMLLSGSDYPIKSDQEILDALHEGGEFLESTAMPHPGHSLDRLDRYFLAPKNRTNKWMRIINALLLRAPKRRWRTRIMRQMAPYSGASWWCLSRECIRHVLSYFDAHPGFYLFFRFSRYPDEVIFQTVIQNSPFAHAIRPTQTYSDWYRPSPPWPATLSSKDLPVLRAIPHLFARKFDLAQDPNIFDRIDAELRGNS